MREYRFLTTWCLEAPPRAGLGGDPRLRALAASGGAASSASSSSSPGDETGSASSARYTWRSSSRTSSTFEMRTTRSRSRRTCSRARRRGELAGHRPLAPVRARRAAAPGDRRRLRVERATTKPWMNLLAPDRPARLRLEPRLGDGPRRRGPRPAARLPPAGERRPARRRARGTLRQGPESVGLRSLTNRAGSATLRTRPGTLICRVPSRSPRAVRAFRQDHLRR